MSNSEIKLLKVKDLVDHSGNKDYFDDITGKKWEEFRDSIAKSGVLAPILVTENNVIVSGHQRVKACRELGIEEIKSEVRDYGGNEKEILKDLIEINVRQRGNIGGSDEQIFNRVEALKDYYGVKRGGDRSKTAGGGFAKKDICEFAGTTEDRYDKIRKLSKAIPEIRELIDDGIISPSTVRELIVRLSDDEQRELVQNLPAMEKITQKQMQEYISELKRKQEEIADLTAQKMRAEARADEAEQAAQAAQESATDANTDYLEEAMRAKEDLDFQEEETRRWKNKAESYERGKRNLENENRKLLGQIKEMEKASRKAEIREVQVDPPDYSDLKNKLSWYESQMEEEHRKNEYSEQFSGELYDILQKIGNIADKQSHFEILDGEQREGLLKIVKNIIERSESIVKTLSGASN